MASERSSLTDRTLVRSHVLNDQASIAHIVSGRGAPEQIVVLGFGMGGGDGSPRLDFHPNHSFPENRDDVRPTPADNRRPWPAREICPHVGTTPSVLACKRVHSSIVRGRRGGREEPVGEFVGDSASAGSEE